MKRILLAGAAFAALSSTSFAADYPLDPAGDAWSGWYAGIQGGYALSGDLDASTTAPIYDVEGGFGGLYWGRNWQSGDWVFGLDGSISLSGIEADLNNPGDSAELRAFSLTRARVGYAFDNVLLFAAVGGSIGRLDVESDPNSDDGWIFGFTAGAGIDMKLADSWSARLEYAYVNYGDEDFDLAVPVNIDIDDVHAMRVGIAYHF